MRTRMRILTPDLLLSCLMDSTVQRASSYTASYFLATARRKWMETSHTHTHTNMGGGVVPGCLANPRRSVWTGPAGSTSCWFWDEWHTKRGEIPFVTACSQCSCWGKSQVTVWALWRTSHGQRSGQPACFRGQIPEEATHIWIEGAVLIIQSFYLIKRLWHKMSKRANSIFQKIKVIAYWDFWLYFPAQTTF